jgi:outer membrane protein TolC
MTCTWRRTGVLGIIWISFFPAARGAEPDRASTLSLDAAVSAALQNNRLIANASLDVGKTQDETAATRAQRYPTLSLNLYGSKLLEPVSFTFQEGIFGTYPATGPIPSKDVKIETPTRFVGLGEARVTQPISQQYKLYLGIHAQEIGEEVAREQLRAERQSIVSSVRKAYYGLLHGESALAASRESLAAAREIERVIRQRFEAGAALEADHLEARARLAHAEYEELAASNGLVTQKEQLNQLLGRELSIDFRAVPLPKPSLTESDLEAAKARALDRRPEARTARLRVSQAEYDSRLQKAAWIPDVSLLLSYVRLQSFDPFVPQNIFSLGFLLQWDALDWGRRSHQSHEKEKTLQQASNAARETEAATRVEVGRLFRSLSEALRRLEAAELSLKASQERMRIAKDRFAAQTILADELLRAQAEAAESNRQYQEALAAFWTTRADWERTVGEDP